jgi:DNA polymerase-3 subunit epsilon
MKNLSLARPLVVLDLETTGIDPKVDRIVEIGALKLLPGGGRDHRTRRLNPGIPIPAAATAVHGITDADVADCPKFSQVAGGLAAFLDGCDLAGFNIKRYDLKLLCAEFGRTRVAFSIAGRAVVDALEIFHVKERRDLTAAMRIYCERDHAGAHGAGADVTATAEILDAMLDRYSDLPRDVGELDAAFRHPEAVDLEGRFRWKQGVVVLAFGKHRGRPVEEVARDHPDYLEWMVRDTFLDDARAVAANALRSQWVHA